MNVLAYDTIHSPFGTLLVVCSKQGVQRIVHQPNESHLAVVKALGAQQDSSAVAPISQQISDFCHGTRQEWDVPIDISLGTHFQKTVWRELLTIPYGHTISYSELAERVGTPKAIRAVGTACGKNPMPLIIPCHRVIGKQGKLGGFAWGLDVKQLLLALEKQNTLIAA